MASPFQQRSLQRKLVYFGLIVALFTVSLLHRKMIINPEAEALRLRQVDQGEVALTDAAIRLSLSGLRGLAVTSLWLGAIEKQRRHEWSELETLVNSLTKLQPHYTSPWLFQSWNLAFNVSVECDRSRDKYFYISRGIELLAEGERKNSPPPEVGAPGHPEMRYYVGFTYQLKIGQGDEKRTLRSLFDLSCIDPRRRTSNKLWRAGAEGKEVDLGKFGDFCKENPRLVRRLREQLGYETPKDVVQFLEDNSEVPSRFERSTEDDSESRLKPVAEQFPVLPPRKDPSWPDPGDPQFGRAGDEQAVDVYEVTRAWYDYAQEPLPPTTGQMLVEPEAIPGRHRLPRMSQYIFRSYPARARAYIGEELQKEGWFDGEGWDAAAAFPDLQRGTEHELLVGRGNRLNGRLAWAKAHQDYLEYGRRNALPTPREYHELQLAKARGDARAAAKVDWADSYLRITNFHDFFDQTAAESDRATAATRRKFYEANRERKENELLALRLYRQALTDWVDVLLRYPAFARQTHVQEDSYEEELAYLRLVRNQNKRQLEALVLQGALLGGPSGFVDPINARPVLLAGAVKQRAPRAGEVAQSLIDYAGFGIKQPVLPRNLAGPLELTYVCGGHSPTRFKGALVASAQLALWPPRLLMTESRYNPFPVERWKTILGNRPIGADPDLVRQTSDNRLLLRMASRSYPPGPPWEPLLPDAAIEIVQSRLGLLAPQQAAP